MKDTAAEYSTVKPSWFVISFSQLGSVGKLFRIKDLPILIQFFLTFFNDKPVDWLLYEILSTKSCRPDQDRKKCEEAIKEVRIQYGISLFQHIGIQSSLKGKIKK